MGATTPAPKSHRRIAPRRHAAVTAAPRPPVAPAERVGVVHLTAEYWPFARTGGLGEAVSGLATTQAAAGHPTTVVMPLYQLVHETTPAPRSGEDTPEIPSPSGLGCRLLLG